jgi:hypothetical protein
LLRLEPSSLAAAALAVLPIVVLSAFTARAGPGWRVHAADKDAPPAPIWTQVSEGGAAEGHVQLAWSGNDWAPDDPSATRWGFELQEAAEPNFEDPLERYRGPQSACFVSGLPDGSWYWRVRWVALEQSPEARAETPDSGNAVHAGPWSDVRSLEVRHHPLAMAWGLFGLGAVLVGAIVVFLGLADRRERRGENA